VKPGKASIWWLHPASVFGGCGILIGISAYAFSEQTYHEAWRTPKFFDAYALSLTLACVAVFILGSVVTSKVTSRVAPIASGNIGLQLPATLLLRLFTIAFWLTILGYCIWAGLAISRGMSLQDVFGVITGEKGAMYDARYTYLPTVGGVTTLTQFGTAAVIIGALVIGVHGWRAVRWRMCILLALAAARALINSERFALIELIVPFTVTCLGVWYLGKPNIRRTYRGLVNLAPLAGVVALFFLFTGFEYFRSWTNYYQGGDLPLLEFGARRLTGYYVTSFNNGAFLLGRLEPLDAPYFTLHFLWGFPLTGPVTKRLFPDPLLETNDKWFYFPFLDSEANLEFNNGDGMMFPLMDFGIAGGLIYWLVIGMACGYLHQSYVQKRPLGLFLYPAIYLGLMEVPLALYWAEGRAFPSMCLLLFAPVLIRLRGRARPVLVQPYGELSAIRRSHA
jgi:hypothetical protein